MTSAHTPRPTYFLFAGTSRAPAGGYRDLVATYQCPTEARRDFVSWRRDPAYQWAELVSFCDGRIAAVCWFGVDRVDRTLARRATVVGVTTVPARRRRWSRTRPPQAPSRA